MKVRTKKRIVTAIGLLAALLMLGIVGGMTLGDMPVGKGTVLAILCEAVSAVMLYKAGWVRL